MSFKFDSDPVHVHAFRSVVKKAKELDEAIDTNVMTPDEAWAELKKFLDATKFPESPEHVKKAQAEAKKVADEEAKAAKKVVVEEPVRSGGTR